MPKKSAGIIVFRYRDKVLEVLLGHPGGPFFAKKDAGVWSIPKGEFTDEVPLKAALREFKEELGCDAPTGEYIELSPVKLPSGKILFTWGVEGEINSDTCVSNTFELEWPPRSGRRQVFPEIDRVAWFTLQIAQEKLSKSLFEPVEELQRLLVP